LSSKNSLSPLRFPMREQRIPANCPRHTARFCAVDVVGGKRRILPQRTRNC